MVCWRNVWRLVAYYSLEKTLRGPSCAAGGESTYATILTFILAMARYPRVQEKLQAELDVIVGSARMPSIEDRPNLPYLNAAIKETYAGDPLYLSVLLDVAASQTFIEAGYFIPKGTIVIPNGSFTRKHREYSREGFYSREVSR